MLIYDKNTILKEENFQNNGLGYLTDFMSEPIITEKLNGTFELQFDYLLTGNNAQYLENFNYIKVWYDDDYQLFYIERVRKQRNKISVYALHIAFTLTKNNLSDVRPTDLTAIAALDYILKRTDEKHYFNAVGNATKGGTSTMYFINKNPIEALLTADNSIINRLGGEIKYNNFNIGLYDQVGNDNGVAVLWGKNLKQFEQDNDISSVITRVIPIGKDGLTLPEGHIDSPLIESYPFPLIKTIDIDVGIEEDESKTEEQLRNDAYEKMRKEVQKLFDAGLDKPTTTVKIDWQDLSKTEEYKNYQFLEKIKLGDTITVKSLNVLVKTRVIETKYNCLSKKFISFTLGDAKDNLFDGTSRIVQKEIKNLNLNPDSLLKQAQDNATKLLVNAMGGYVYKTNNELYIMDTDDPKTATRVWRWNINGLGYSKSGINGPYGLAMTMDGQIVADFITTGKMSVERIEGLEEILLMVQNFSDGIKTVEGNNSINLDNVLTSELLYLQIYPTKEDLSYLNISPKTGLGNNTKLTSRDLLFLKDPKNVFNGKLENGSIDKDGQNGTSPELDTTTYIELKEKLNSINDVADELDIISGKGIKRIGEYIFTGDETINKVSSAEVLHGYYFTVKIPVNAYYGTFETPPLSMLCSHFKVIKNSIGFFDNGSITISSTKDKVCLYIDETYSEVEQIKQFLKENSVKIYYVLETPEEFATEPVNIQLRKGYNRIEINDKNGLLNKTKLSYLADTEKTVDGTNQIIIEDAEPVSARSLIVYGNSFQNTRSGKNLYNYTDTTTVTSGVTADEDGWITINGDNQIATYYNYWTNGLNLKENTDYAIVLEIKSVSGTGKILPVSTSSNNGQFDRNLTYNFDELQNGDLKINIMHTKADFSSLSNLFGLRTFASFASGQSGSITFRLSVLEDTSIIPEQFIYEPYGAMPSPEFPSEVKCVEGLENIFDKDTATRGWIINYETGELLRSGGYFTSDYIPVKPNTKYTFTNILNYYLVCFDKDKNYIGYMERSNTSTTLPGAAFIRASGQNNNIDLAQIVEGITQLPYLPYGKSFLQLVDTGKNMFDINNPLALKYGFGSSSSAGTINSDGTITTSRNLSSSRAKGTPVELEKNTDYIISIFANSIETTGLVRGCIELLAYNNDDSYNSIINALAFTDIGKTISLEVNSGDYEKYAVHISGYFGSGNSGTLIYSQPMVRKADTNDIYEPYIPNKVRNTEKFAIEKTTYTIDLNGATDVYLFFYDENDNLISKSGYHKLPYTFNNVDAKYVRFMFKNVNNDNLDVNDIKNLTIYDVNANEPAIRYTLPCNLYYINDEIKDELIIDYEKEQTFVIKRVGINAETGEKYALDEEKTQSYTYKKIILEDGNYLVKMQSFNSGYIKVKYLSKTLYTSQYATKVGVEASLKLTEDTIIAGVNKQVVAINGEITKLSGELTVAAEEINSKVAKGAIISTINQSAETVKILANKIALAAGDILTLLANNTINLSSKNIQIESDNFTVTADGHLITKKGEFEDCTITGGYLNLKNGAAVVGDNGLATNLQYQTGGQYLGKSMVGFAINSYKTWDDSTPFKKNDLAIIIQIPDNFTVRNAYVTINHSRVINSINGGTVYGYCRNLKLYKASSNKTIGIYSDGFGCSGWLDVGSYSGTEIKNAFGSNGYTATNYNSDTIEVKKSIDIGSSLSKGTNILFLSTSQTTSSTAGSPNDAVSKTGAVQMTVDVIGYMNF